MSASTNMPRLLMLALTAKVCSGQVFDVDPAGVVAPPAHECPMMSDLGATSSLQTVPWSFFRTINIMQQVREVQGQTSPSFPAVPNQRPLGQVRATPFSWTYEFVLHHPQTDKEITKIVNPGVLWDTTQDIYDCMGRLMGKLTHPHPFDWQNIFTNSYLKHQVLDSQGNHIANLVQERLTASFFGSRQHFIYLQDTSGNAMASMRHPSGGWRMNPFGEYFNAQIVMQSMNAQVQAPAMSPEFLSLVFANALAAENRLGPYVSMIVYPILLIFCVCAGLSFVAWLLRCKNCFTCCGICGKTVPESPKVEEKETLIMKEEKRDVWSCCSRRQVVAPGWEAPKK